MISFKEALKLSKRLTSTLRDSGLDGPTTLTSWSKWQEFSTATGGTQNLHLHFHLLLAGCSFSFDSWWLSFWWRKIWFRWIQVIVWRFFNKVEWGELKQKTNWRAAGFHDQKRLSPSINKMHRIYTLLASFDRDYIPSFLRTISHFLFFRFKNHYDPKFSSTFRQILRHGNFNLVLVINRDHIISFWRPFASSQSESRYYFSLSIRKCFPVLLLWFVGKLTRRWRWREQLIPDFEI